MRICCSALGPRLRPTRRNSTGWFNPTGDGVTVVLLIDRSVRGKTTSFTAARLLLLPAARLQAPELSKPAVVSSAQTSASLPKLTGTLAVPVWVSSISKFTSRPASRKLAAAVAPTVHTTLALGADWVQLTLPVLPVSSV